MKRKSSHITEHFFTPSSGRRREKIPILVSKHPTARSFVVRYQPLRQCLSLTVPRYASVRQALRFVEERREWIEEQLAASHTPVPLAPGETIPFLGKHYKVIHKAGRGLVTQEEDCLIVHGEREFASRRLGQWLKTRAREEIVRLAMDYASRLEVKPRRITLRDPTTRWGSCSHAGDLSFSWRLIFAPYEVMDYLVAHEVAHLREYNHSPAFWKLVAGVCPGWKSRRGWLEENGETLYRYKLS